VVTVLLPGREERAAGDQVAEPEPRTEAQPAHVAV
jgi:hypothetical protein